MDRPTAVDADTDTIATFLVERYWPGIDLDTLRAALPRLEAAARAMTAEGTSVVHVASILMPVDEVVFSLIAAGDEQLVRELNARAGLPVDRIATAITLTPGQGPDPAGGVTP
jgi:hypothetical protein